MPLKLGDPVPSLEGATEWLNSTATSVVPTSGKPLLVHFWSVSCYLCKNNFPALNELKRKYGARGLQVVAIHMPRQEEDTDPQKVRDCVAQCGIDEACAIDNEHRLKDAFKNDQGWVPAYFLFDEAGVLKARSAGEAGIGVLTSAFERLYGSAAIAPASAEPVS